MSAISVSRLWKSYGEQVVLEDINLEVKPNEFVTVVGASGCGKTTFLRILLGMEPPSRGRVTLDGKPLPQEPDRERGIVFQRYSVFPHLTVLQNVLLGLELQAAPLLGRLLGARRREAVAECEALLEQVGLYAHRHKYPAALSGGMRQRLSIAGSVICKPRVLLLDEPFGALDPGISADMHQLVLRIWEEFGLTIFMITHDLREGFRLGTRLLVFDKVRHDPQAPEAYGATITYDLALNRAPARSKALLAEVSERTAYSEAFARRATA